MDKRIILLSVIMVFFLTICSVSATDNVTDDMVCIGENDASNTDLQQSSVESTNAISDLEQSDIVSNESINSENILTYSSVYDNETDDGDILATDVDSQLLESSNLPEVLSVSNDDDLLSSSKISSKTFKVGKYKSTFSAWEIKSILDAKEYDYYKTITHKTGKYFKVKKAKYKTKTKYKTVCFGKGKYTYGFWINEYTSKGWSLVKTWQKGSYYDPMYGSMYKKCYAKFKKNVKVKSGTKTVKYRVKVSLSSHYENGQPTPYNKACLTVWCSAGIISAKNVKIV